MDETQTRRVTQDWVDAWNRGDLDRIMTHYADDVTFSAPTVAVRWGIESGQLHGTVALRAHFARGLQAPNLHFELLDVLLGMDGYTLVYRRETGALVADVVAVDEQDRGKTVRVYYGAPTVPSPG